MKTIVICSSVAFYRKAVDLQEELQKQGYTALVPDGATKMKKTGNFAVSSSKTWFENPEDYHKKAKLMRDHFDKVAKGDAVLILNDEKHGVANYIGGNVLMEMSLAFYLNKPIYILNDIPEDSPFVEEIIGMGSVPLHGKLEALPRD